MKPSDKTRFAEILFGLAEITGSELSEPGLELFYRALEHFTIEVIDEAAIAILQERKYTKLPMPADFIAKIEGELEDRSRLIAHDVLSKVRKIGRSENVEFDDPIVNSLIRAKWGGWKGLCVSLMSKEISHFLLSFSADYIALKKASNYGIVLREFPFAGDKKQLEKARGKEREPK